MRDIRNLTAPARIVVGAVIALMVAMAPLGAPTAHADATDDAFIAGLHAAGVQFGNTDVAKGLAKGFCKQVKRDTKSVAWAVSGLVTGGIPRKMATTFAGQAAKAYCPSMLASLNLI
jgi:hypothetical protein